MRVRDADVLALAGKVRYEIDPENPYPDAFTGHLRATLRDGTVHELRQDHMRGGAHAPLTAAELETKFLDNARTAAGMGRSGCGTCWPDCLRRRI